jgi:hypothetical protein
MPQPRIEGRGFAEGTCLAHLPEILKLALLVCLDGPAGNKFRRAQVL